MISLLYILIKMLRIILTVLQFMMMFRAFMSWMPIDDDSKIGNFIYAMTEPIVYPVRLLLRRFDALADLPIDISFVIAFTLLSMIRIMLPVV